MKTGWRKHSTRKDKLEDIALHHPRFTDAQSAEAWNRLMERLIALAEPEARIPKFNDLVLAIIAARVAAKRVPVEEMAL